MKIEAIATAQQVGEDRVKNKTVVVIDVLRATSVMITALRNGASEVIPVLSPDEAFSLKNQLGHMAVLGGERHAEPIDGFDFGNSPLSYTEDVIKGKTLVMTTTNGTLAIKNAVAAEELLVASFLNDMAVAKYLSDKKEVVLVCSGNNGVYTLEDALCAGRIIGLLRQMCDKIRPCDLALSMESLYDLNVTDLRVFAAKGHHYKVLEAKGCQADLIYCFRSNETEVLPFWSGQSLKTTVGDRAGASAF